MYIETPNRKVGAAHGITYAYRRCGPRGAQPPLLLLQHFRGTLDSWDPALVDALAAERDVIAFDNAGVGLSSGSAPGPSGTPPSTPWLSSRRSECDTWTCSGSPWAATQRRSWP